MLNQIAFLNLLQEKLQSNSIKSSSSWSGGGFDGGGSTGGWQFSKKLSVILQRALFFVLSVIRTSRDDCYRKYLLRDILKYDMIESVQ